MQRLIGVSLRRKGDLAGATDRLRRARQLSRLLRDDRATAVVENTLAFVLLAAGDTNAARKLFDDILGDTHRLAVLPVEAIALRGRAECELRDGKVEAASSGLRRSQVELRQLGLRREAAVAQQLLGQAYRAAGHELRARTALQNAASIAFFGLSAAWSWRKVSRNASLGGQITDCSSRSPRLAAHNAAPPHSALTRVAATPARRPPPTTATPSPTRSAPCATAPAG